jgi:general secretion pathway protein L
MEHALNNFRQALREIAAKLGLPAFWRWWMGELAPLVPMAPRAALQRRRLRPILAFGDGVAVLWEPRVVDGALVLAEAARVPLGTDAAAIAQSGRVLIEALPPRAAGGAVKIVVALPRAQVLRKRLTLPAAVEENLREALAYDLDRHTPFRADQLYFDAAVIGRDLAKREITVDWAAALKTAVDAARRHAETWGAVVVGVTPEAPEPGSATVVPPARWSKLNLLPEEERPEAVLWRRPQFLLPAALLGIAALIAIVLPIWQKRDYAIALTEVTEQARVQAAASDALRQLLDLTTGDYNFALGKKYAFPSTVQLLDDVTRILPDDTWLTQFDVKSVPKGKEPRRDILLRGESGNAGRLVSALEDSKMFGEAAPRSPTTKIQPGPGEVFDLGAQVKPLPPPEMIQLVSAAPAASARPTDGAALPAREGAGAAAAAPAPGAPATATPPATPAPAPSMPAGAASATPPPASTIPAPAEANGSAAPAAPAAATPARAPGGRAVPAPAAAPPAAAPAAAATPPAPPRPATPARMQPVPVQPAPPAPVDTPADDKE